MTKKTTQAQYAALLDAGLHVGAAMRRLERLWLAVKQDPEEWAALCARYEIDPNHPITDWWGKD